MESVLITGGTGLVGNVLVEELLRRKYHVIVMTRGEKDARDPNVQYAYWDVEKQTIDDAAVASADHIYTWLAPISVSSAGLIKESR
ncbi:NAD-dependent epimerase/dehydratase family protein [Niabella hibiscisoli]|uniref:NAD-dependent epimerase/dehydratase family protein n=1 Tax=Niabella hibiscisoli TaxID=1825928 RepID=UPI001F0F10D7|nr:NAD-dependent epimerase/dehydratase family protein [Niabella hibiscisoli]MCH5714705.1 NAD-dependent epimerase/dehydratase family protein [Niabella hibiscisoli]